MSDYVDRIRPDSYGITTYLENLRRGQYQIPTFQRDVVWDRNRVKRLWDSIYKFYPLGSILVWRTETRLQNHRELGGHPLHDELNRREFQYLLDGQQRTTALLTSVYGGRIKGQEGHDPHLYVDLTVESLEDIEDESWRSRFLFWDEIDDQDGQLLRNVGRKKRFDEGVIVKLQEIAHKYTDLERRLEAGGRRYDDPAREQLRRFRQVLDNYKLSFIELRGIEVSEVCQIFERINQAGQPLSMFDIVVAKTYRPDRKADGKEGFYLRGLFEAFQRDLEHKGSRFASVDDMTLLQILAVLVRDAIPDAGVHNITDTYLNALRTEHLEGIWLDAATAIERVFDFFDNHLRLPGPSLVPYRYFYLTLASYLFRNKSPDHGMLKRYFWHYSFHDDDLLSNTTHLRDHIRRLHDAKTSGQFDFEPFILHRDKLRSTTYSSRGRLSRALLALYANQDPRDWKHTDRSVLSSVYYQLTDHPNLHHIFPLDFCEKNLGEYGQSADSLLNIAYLTQITNLQISNRHPLEYIKDYLGPGFDVICSTHLLPEIVAEWAQANEMPKNALNIFIEKRFERVLERLRQYLGDISIRTSDASEFEAVSGN
jgi:hypothetical protein